MKLTAQILLNPTPEQAQLLVDTIRQANAACNEVSTFAWEKKLFRKFDLQKELYYGIKDKYNLSAQMVVRCLSKVADSYKLDKNTERSFRPLGSIAYDTRILSYKTLKQTVSIWTLQGRQTIPYLVGEHHKQLLQYQQGESDLVFKKGRFYLLATCEVPEEESEPFVGVIGVDLGIVQIATTSDNQSYSGQHIEQVRQWYFNRKQVLQSVGTPSAKRRLRQLSGREAKFRKDTNHRISKELVQNAKYTNRAIVLEDLSGIRKGVKVKKAQRAKHSSWGFYELRSFIQYKAKQKGVSVVLINPAYTSRTCSECGCSDKANRKSQSDFACKDCGHSENADYNAAKNIRHLGLLSIQPMVSAKAVA
jgi:putative transposase